MAEFGDRSVRRIRDSVRKTDALRKEVRASRAISENRVQGLLKDTLNAPTDFGDTAEKQQVQVWVVTDHKLHKTTREITVYNHDPSLFLSKGAYVMCEMVANEWRIFWVACSTYEDKLEDGDS